MELLESTGQLAKMQTVTEAAQRFIDSIKPNPSTLAMIEASNSFVEKNRSILSTFEDNYAKCALPRSPIRRGRFPRAPCG